MKVRESQIPEEDGKPKHQNGKKMKTTVNKSNDWDDEEDSDSLEDDEDKRKLLKTMISFNEGEIIISAYDLHTIEKDIKFVEKPKAHFEYGISINKGLTPGQYITKTDISLWYLHEDTRDEKYEKVMEILKREGLKVIDV